MMLHIDGLVQDFNISIANVLEILQTCNKPSIYEEPNICPKWTLPLDISDTDVMVVIQKALQKSYGSGHGTVAVLLPGFAINW